MLFIFYWPNTQYSAQIIYPENEDGIKNAYVVQYHVLYDSSYWHFQGMNYPYGEHVAFTDGQPLIENALLFINRNIVHFTARGVLSMMNWLMLAGIVAGAVFMCMVLMEFGVAWWYAALAGCGIVYLSPQLGRFLGHFALSYTFVVPLLWLLWIRYFKNPSYSRSIGIAICMILLSFIHFYYMALLIFMGVCLWAFYSFTKKQSWKAGLTNFTLQIVLPFVVVKLIMLATDHITDRPTHPWGFFDYKNSWGSLLIPFNTAFGQFIYNIYPYDSVEWEVNNYMGFMTIAGTAALIIKALWAIAARKWQNISPVPGNKLVAFSFFTAIIVLLLSAGMPFIGPLQKLFAYMGPLRQFRSIGRFAWVSFYMLGGITFAAIYYYSSRTSTAKRNVFLIISLILLYADNINAVRLTPQFNTHKYEYLAKQGINRNDYQAILPFPCFNIGSENISMDIKCQSFQIAENLSLYTGLPIVSQMMSRSSGSQVLKNIAIVFEEYRPLGIANDIRSDKPFLITVSADCNDLRSEEKALISRATLIRKADKVLLYSLPVSVLKAVGKDIEPYTKNCDSNRGHVVYSSFDDKPSDKKYMGSGALQSNIDDSMILYNGPSPVDTGNSYELLVWAYVVESPMGLSQFSVYQKDASGQIVQSNNFYLREHMVTFDGYWTLVSCSFPKAKAGVSMAITMHNSLLQNQRLYVDEMLLKPQNLHFYSRIQGYDMIDDRFYPLKTISLNRKL